VGQNVFGFDYTGPLHLKQGNQRQQTSPPPTWRVTVNNSPTYL